LCLCRFQFASYCRGWLRSFSFAGCSLVGIVSSTTPGSVSLVHGFTHDNCVPYLFSTPQARSEQQTEILIHLMKKLATVNDMRGVLYLVHRMWIFSPQIWRELDVVPNDAPRDFDPDVAFGTKFQIPVARQGGREMSAPRPYVTEPFCPLSSINNW